MKRVFFALGCALTLAVLPACDDPAPAPKDAAALPDAFAAAYCDALGRCGVLDFQSMTRAECLALVRTSMLQVLNGGLQAVARETARYDQATAQHAIELLGGFTCRRGDLTATAIALGISRAFIGQLTTGATCGFDEECADGDCSPGGNCHLSCCIGSCRPLVGLGAPCSIGQCQAGLDCVGGKCAERPSVGGSCAGTLGCRDATCDPTTLTCIPFAATGGACTSSGACDSFMDACIDGTCQRRMALEQPCKRDDACRSNRCRGTCQPSLGEGAACMVDTDCKTTRCRSAQGEGGPRSCQVQPPPPPPSCP